MMRAGRIGVLMGGVSAEREVSLRSGAAISRALRGLGHEVEDIDVGRDVCIALRERGVEVAFLALHGGAGEDGSVQGLLEVMGIPYTGSGVLASALAMDKVASKRIFEAVGLRVPRYHVLLADEGADDIPLSPPLVVKPSREGSSVGVSVVREAGGLAGAIGRARAFGGPVLVEEYVKAREVNIGILGGRVLGGVEIRPKAEFYSYEAKYTAGMTEYILPPEISEEVYEEAALAAREAHRALGCAGATRVDLLIDEAGAVHVLEVNTIPGMTETSLLPKIAARAGLDFPALVEEMLSDALGRAGEGRHES